MRGSTVRVQLAAAGEFPLVIAYANIVQNLAEKGAPVDWLPLEPAVIPVNTVMIGSNARHPNAAKLLVDFTLSKEGQEKLWDFQRIPARTDVEPRPARLFRGYKRHVVAPEDYKNHDEVVKLYSQIFANALTGEENVGPANLQPEPEFVSTPATRTTGSRFLQGSKDAFREASKDPVSWLIGRRAPAQMLRP